MDRLTIKAQKETRYNHEGVSFEYNPFSHGYYPVKGWTFADIFEQMVERLQAEVIWNGRD